MACSIQNHHTISWIIALLAILLAETLAHSSNALWASSMVVSAGGNTSLQVPARHCHPEHAAALLQLKGSFTFTASSNACPYQPANTTLPSWIEGTDCCRWEGVACDHVVGSVTGLNLSSGLLGINGSGLHPALFRLTSLKHLVLDGNNFCGSQLPASGFEKLTRLEELSFADCNLTGAIPPSFSALHSIKTISLASNDFNGSTFPLGITHLKNLQILDFRYMTLSGAIPSSIGNLSSLTELYLTGNEFSGGLPSSLSNLTYLSRLDCSRCCLSGQVPSLENLLRLESIDLHDNNFEGGLPSSLSNLTYLSRLECSNSGLSGRVPSLKNLSRLEFLDLSSNNLEGNIPLNDADVLRNLQWVDMSGNSFTGAILASIFTQPALEDLDLSSNYLSGHIEEFQNPSATLQKVSLSNNNLTGTIPTSFSQLSALTELELNSNNFVGTLDLYPYLMLRNLSGITASNNPLLSVSADDRGESTINSSRITELHFASCGLARVPSVLKYLPELDFLDLSNNSIHGSIPDWIWRNMSSLHLHHNLFSTIGQVPAYAFIYDLDLSFNKLAGLVPFPFNVMDLDYSNNEFSSIAPLDFLRQVQVTRSLYLANNKLSGHIPYMECHQDYNLTILDLSGNNFSGPVPPYLLKGCGNVLEAVNLRDNHLNGTWPDEIGVSCYLVVIDLHGNQIEGRLPRSLANCYFLQELDIGGNKFVDVFPSWLGNNPVLRILILRSIKFYGPLSIPDGKKNHVDVVATGYFSGIQIIDLAENSFNGVLPTELFDGFKAMHMVWSDYWLDNGILPRDAYFDGFPYSASVDVAMKQQYLRNINGRSDLVVIDLSYNRFSGTIPETIGNLTPLIVLNLSHNTLSGNIPAEFGRLSNVESLDLSWNNLTGSIPQAMASLTNLEVLNLSYNDLSGSIPTGSQFNTFTSSSYQGGNQGLYGCPLPIRCNLRQPTPAASAPAPPASPTAINQSFEAVILWLFVGSGYGIGIAVSIVLQMACCGRYMNDTLEKIASCIA